MYLLISKPGASASAVYLAHEVIGLTPEGHGTLLGEASFTCRKVRKMLRHIYEVHF